MILQVTLLSCGVYPIFALKGLMSDIFAKLRIFYYFQFSKNNVGY